MTRLCLVLVLVLVLVAYEARACLEPACQP